jgi:uncharacterized membrane protein YdbT with pleckstrin-like domain
LFTILAFTPLAQIFTTSGLAWEAVGFFVTAWLLIVWMIGWDMFTDYYLDVLIITDKRIFDIEQYGLFRRRSSAFRLDRIQNVSVNVHGIIQTLLDFGTIRLETAGEHEDFVAPFIGQPYDVKKFISSLQDGEMDKTQQVKIEGQHITQVDEATKPNVQLTKNDGDGL